MGRKVIYLLFLILILRAVSGASADMVGWWKLDDGAGTNFVDSSGNSHHGTIEPENEDLVRWTTNGYQGGALEFTTTTGTPYTFADAPLTAGLLNIAEATYAFWMNMPPAHQEWGIILVLLGEWHDSSIEPDENGALWVGQDGFADWYWWGNAGVPLNDGQWHHVAVTFSSSNDIAILYVDGLEIANTSSGYGNGTGWHFSDAISAVRIGGPRNRNQWASYTGRIDEVMVFNETLAAAAVADLFRYGLKSAALASKPDPPDGSTDAPRDVVLSWTPGAYVAGLSPKHKVFFSDNVNDVEDGIGGVTQDANSYTVAELLAWGQTYYWRVDEANSVTGWDQGDVWQFRAETFAYAIAGTAITATASSSHEAGMGPEKTIDGSGLDDNDLHGTVGTDIWLSSGAGPQPTWIQYEFHRVYKLHEMWVWNFNQSIEPWVGWGLRDVTVKYSTDGSDWTELDGVPEFAQATGSAGYDHDTTVDFKGVLAKYVKIIANSNWGVLTQYGLSEVRFLHVPVWARYPSPQDEATGIGPDVVLSWRPGREAAIHKVSVSSNRNAVVNGTVAAITVSETSYDAGTLELGKAYYWKINEVNEAETPTTWEGDVWSFVTSEYLVVDDMESYGDANTPGEPGGRVWYVWKDGTGWSNPPPGYGGNGTGSSIGNWPPPIAEIGIVNSGKQSMPYRYNNSGSTGKLYYSEATADIDDLAIGPDWTRAGAKALTLWFYGDASNDANSTEQMYMKVNGAKIPYDGDMSDVREESWHEWSIDLASFGVSLQSVTEISIGFGDEDNTTTPGGSGVVYFDDVRLYPSRCVLSRRSADFAKVDYIEDCVVDYRELEVMAGDWLFTDSVAATAAPSPTGLIAYYQFDGNANDSSGNGNDGVLAGDPQWVAGRLNGALEFDGIDDYVGTAKSLLSEMSEFTLAGWVSAGNPEASRIGLFGQNDCIEFGFDSGYLAVWTATGNQMVDAEWTFKNLTWHHVAAVGNGTSLTVYIDGQPAETGGTAVSDYGFSTFEFNIGGGGIWDASDNWFLGQIDEVRVYSRALTDPEVAYLADTTPDDGQLYIPVPSLGNLYDGEMPLSRSVNLKDFAELANSWLEEQLWP